MPEPSSPEILPSAFSQSRHPEHSASPESCHPERSAAESKDLRLSFDRSPNPASSEPQLRILLYDEPLSNKKPPTRAQTLYHHFFRRFFDNDTLSLDGETQTTVIRALAFVAIPTFMFAFWLLPSYPG